MCLGILAGDALSAHFATWRLAFGDMTWSGYKQEVMETFHRARSMRLSPAATLRNSLRRMGSSLTGRSFSVPDDAHPTAASVGQAGVRQDLPRIDEDGIGP